MEGLTAEQRQNRGNTGDSGFLLYRHAADRKWRLYKLTVAVSWMWIAGQLKLSSTLHVPRRAISFLLAVAQGHSTSKRQELGCILDYNNEVIHEMSNNQVLTRLTQKCSNHANLRLQAEQFDQDGQYTMLKCRTWLNRIWLSTVLHLFRLFPHSFSVTETVCCPTSKHLKSYELLHYSRHQLEGEKRRKYKSREASACFVHQDLAE